MTNMKVDQNVNDDDDDDVDGDDGFYQSCPDDDDDYLNALFTHAYLPPYKPSCGCVQENAVNGNDQTNTTTILEETVKQPTTDLKESNAAAIITEQQQQQTNETTEETRRTDLELDTEVSQINTQSNQKSAANSEPAESYSRPMSRTSSLVIKAITLRFQFLVSRNYYYGFSLSVFSVCFSRFICVIGFIIFHYSFISLIVNI